MKMDSLQTQILDIMRQSGPYDQDQNKGKCGIATPLQQGNTISNITKAIRLTTELVHISLCYIHCTTCYLCRAKIYQYAYI